MSKNAQTFWIIRSILARPHVARYGHTSLVHAFFLKAERQGYDNNS